MASKSVRVVLLLPNCGKDSVRFCVVLDSICQERPQAPDISFVTHIFILHSFPERVVGQDNLRVVISFLMVGNLVTSCDTRFYSPGKSSSPYSLLLELYLPGGVVDRMV